MSGKAVFIDKSANFFRKNNAFIDVCLGHMTQDIEVALKTTAGMPVKHGQMKASTRHFRNERGKFRVMVNKEYASAQEAGVVDGHPIKNYTTAGTSAGFFQRAITSVERHRDMYIQMARKAVGL